MNEAWKKIFKDYIKCYEAIETLNDNDMLDDDYRAELQGNLLEGIITTFKSEVQ